MDWTLRASLNAEVERSIRLKFADVGKEDLDQLCKDILAGFHWRIARGNELPDQDEAIYGIPLLKHVSTKDPRLVNGQLQLSR